MKNEKVDNDRILVGCLIVGCHVVLLEGKHLHQTVDSVSFEFINHLSLLYDNSKLRSMTYVLTRFFNTLSLVLVASI